MSDLRLALRQIRYENAAFWRNPPSAFFTFAFPLIFLVLFNLLFGNQTIRLGGRQVSQSTFYVPAIAAFSIVTATFTNLAIGVSFARDQGLLKRLRGTPLPPWAYLAGRVGHAVLITLLLVVIVTLSGAAFYGVDIPTTRLGAAAIATVAGAFAFASLGLAMTAAVANAEASPAVVNGVILPILFISDIFIPTEDAPDWLVTLGEVFPVKHLSEAMQTAFHPFETGPGFEWGHLAVVAGWGLAGVLVALRFFSWEPPR